MLVLWYYSAFSGNVIGPVNIVFKWPCGVSRNFLPTASSGMDGPRYYSMLCVST